MSSENTTKKVLVCKSCGASAEVITDCTCTDCGIRCCGKPMETSDNVIESNADGKKLSCKSCGAEIKVIKDCTCDNCGFSCCGKAMS